MWSFAQQLPLENKFQAILKLELLRKSLNYEKIETTEYNVMCRKCHIPWTAGFFSVEVIPGCKRSRMQIQQLECKGELTKQQQSLVKYLKTRIGRTAKYTCQICSYKTRIQLDARVKLPEFRAPVVASKDEQMEIAYQKWLEETQKKRKRHGKSNAGLKLPPKPKNASSDVSKPATSSAAGNKKGSFKPTDFRLIQRMLANTMSAKSNNKPAPKTFQPIGHLRLSRN
uniref:Uncharacterized protein n=1 Tax=Anopheles christyi TaxID=43041 RepID=A0A182JSC8_9DIPT